MVCSSLLSCFCVKKNKDDVSNADTYDSTSGQYEELGSLAMKRLKTKESHEGELITVSSYNVLAQNLLEKHIELYSHNIQTPEVLTWEYRKTILEQQLIKLDSDIFCLQEVQTDHFDTFYRPFFNNRGYGCVFSPRSDPFQDGALIAYRIHRFEVVHFMVKEYTAGIQSGMHTPHIGQILRLQTKAQKKELVIANTHLLFCPTRGDTKIGQLAMLLSAIDEEARDNGCAPFLLCGDFNTVTNSPVFKFLTESRVHFDGRTGSELSGNGKGGPVCSARSALPKATGVDRNCILFKYSSGVPTYSESEIVHQYDMKPVWQPNSNELNSPCRVTFRTKTDFGMPDQIFYCNSKQDASFKTRLQIIDCMKIPSLQQAKCPWPDRFQPSDHIPISADFLLLH